MGKDREAAGGNWLAEQAQVAPPGQVMRWERTVEWAFEARANSTVRTSRWQRVQQGQGFDFTVQAFGIQQRGEQQCLYWQIPNTKAR